MVRSSKVPIWSMMKLCFIFKFPVLGSAGQNYGFPLKVMPAHPAFHLSRMSLLPVQVFQIKAQHLPTTAHLWSPQGHSCSNVFSVYSVFMVTVIVIGIGMLLSRVTHSLYWSVLCCCKKTSKRVLGRNDVHVIHDSGGYKVQTVW